MKPVVIEGEVVRGRSLGGKLGFPTANLEVGSDCTLADGVYAAIVRIGGAQYGAVANLGYRPTVEQTRGRRLLEVNIFGYEGSLYGETISAQLTDFIRPETKFNSVEELQKAVQQDIKNAQNIIKEHRK